MHLRFHSSAVGRGSVRRGERSLAGVGQAGQRRDHRARVAVGPDDAGVGIGVEQRVEVPQVVRRLEDPALRRLARLQGLERQPVLGVGGRHVGLFEPAGVGRHVGLGLEGERAHVVHEQAHALLGDRRAERVHGLERRVQLHQPVELLGRLGDAWVLGRALERRRRDGVGRLPLQQRPGHRVEAEQDRQQARPGAGQADDDPRARRSARRGPRGARWPSAAARCDSSVPMTTSSRSGSGRTWSARPRPRTTPRNICRAAPRSCRCRGRRSRPPSPRRPRRWPG